MKKDNSLPFPEQPPCRPTVPAEGATLAWGRRTHTHMRKGQLRHRRGRGYNRERGAFSLSPFLLPDLGCCLALAVFCLCAGRRQPWWATGGQHLLDPICPLNRGLTTAPLQRPRGLRVLRWLHHVADRGSQGTQYACEQSRPSTVCCHFFASLVLLQKTGLPLFLHQAPSWRG